jgi:hypothetical protein
MQLSLKEERNQGFKTGLHGTCVTRVVLASVDHAPCQRERSLKREPTRAYQCLHVGK